MNYSILFRFRYRFCRRTESIGISVFDLNKAQSAVFLCNYIDLPESASVISVQDPETVNNKKSACSSFVTLSGLSVIHFIIILTGIQNIADHVSDIAWDIDSDAASNIDSNMYSNIDSNIDSDIS